MLRARHGLTALRRRRAAQQPVRAADPVPPRHRVESLRGRVQGRVGGVVGRGHGGGRQELAQAVPRRRDGPVAEREAAHAAPRGRVLWAGWAAGDQPGRRLEIRCRRTGLRIVSYSRSSVHIARRGDRIVLCNMTLERFTQTPNRQQSSPS